MMLLTQQLRKQLPPLYSREENPAGQAVAVVKFFTPWTNWTWYATEYDGEDLFYGLVDGHCKELGYFSLSELQSLNGPWGLKIERDRHWSPKPLEQIAPELFDTEGGE